MMYYLLFMIPGLLLGLWAQMKLSSTYGKFSKIGVASRRTGAETAREILDQAGLHDMPINEVPGHLSDHYDPTKKALFLSPEVFHGTSIASVGVAAHEAGHALQHQAAYGMFNLRMALVPVTQFASYAYIGIIILGMVLGLMKVAIPIIIVIFTVIALFQLVTLPVEYDASARAKEQLFRLGLVHQTERDGVAKVLNAAALTYVAALVSTVMTLLYYVTSARDER